MYEERFCGKTGPRTVFTIDAKCGYRIELFSFFGEEEAEVLFPPLTLLEVTHSSKQCDPQCIVDKDAGMADQIIMKQVMPSTSPASSPPPPAKADGADANANTPAPDIVGLIKEMESIGFAKDVIFSGLQNGKTEKQQLAEWCIANTPAPAPAPASPPVSPAAMQPAVPPTTNGKTYRTLAAHTA
jgi:hypothetical protein